MSITAHPLQWPTGRPRTANREPSNFKVTLGVARDELFAEIDRLGGRSVVVSSNIPLRLDGKPYANAPQPSDRGVAAYFTYRGRAMCFACDRWDRVEDNMRAIAKTIDALRGIARWGTGDMLQAAFSGFTALPAPSAKREWWEVLGIDRNATVEAIRGAYRALASKHHPDKPGGSHEKMAELNAAQEAALQECAP